MTVPMPSLTTAPARSRPTPAAQKDPMTRQPVPSPSAHVGPLELAAAFQQGFLAAVVRLAGNSCPPAALARCQPEGPSRVFRGTPDQVAAVRRFARARLGNHPAADDTVLVASELGANAVTHTTSGHAGGLFLVYVTAISGTCAAVLVTDQGSRPEPRLIPAGNGRETGRGLHIVASLTTVFIPFGGPSGRTMLAVIGSANTSQQPVCDQEEPPC